MMIALLAAMTVTQANADGFKCEGLNSGTRIQVYNHTDAAAGTRKVAVMVVSDYNVNSPMIMTTTPFHTKVADDSKLVSTFAT